MKSPERVGCREVHLVRDRSGKSNDVGAGFATLGSSKDPQGSRTAHSRLTFPKADIHVVSGIQSLSADPNASFSGPSQGSYGRHAFAPSLLIGRRTCSALGVRTGR